MRAFLVLVALVAESMLINSASAQGWTYIISNKAGQKFMRVTRIVQGQFAK